MNSLLNIADMYKGKELEQNIMLQSDRIAPITSQSVCFFDCKNFQKSPQNAISEWVSQVTSLQRRNLAFVSNSELLEISEK